MSAKEKMDAIMEELRKAHNMFDFDLILELTTQLELVRIEKENSITE